MAAACSEDIVAYIRFQTGETACREGPSLCRTCRLQSSSSSGKASRSADKKKPESHQQFKRRRCSVFWRFSSFTNIFKEEFLLIYNILLCSATVVHHFPEKPRSTNTSRWLIKQSHAIYCSANLEEVTAFPSYFAFLAPFPAAIPSTCMLKRKMEGKFQWFFSFSCVLLDQYHIWHNYEGRQTLWMDNPRVPPHGNVHYASYWTFHNSPIYTTLDQLIYSSLLAHTTLLLAISCSVGDRYSAMNASQNGFHYYLLSKETARRGPTYKKALRSVAVRCNCK